MQNQPGDLSEILFDRVTAWLKRTALSGENLETLISGVCERMAAAGLPLVRAHLSFSMLHPLYDALSFTWNRGKGVAVQGYRAKGEGSDPARFRASPYFHLLQHNLDHLRRRIDRGGTQEFPILVDLAEAGVTDYFAFMQAFDQSTGQGMMGSWATDAANGFSDDMLKALLRIQDSLAVAAKMAVLSKLADNMMTTYLGAQVGKRVLSGQVRRGDGQTIRAAIVMADMRDSTGIAERGGREVYIDTLNQFFDALATPFNGGDGEILSFIGDGFLAIFPCERRREASQIAAKAAMEATRHAVARAADLNRGRKEKGLDEIRFGIGMHVGNVMLGNVGLRQRLTFSAFGAAVNEAHRLESLTKKYGEQVVASETFANYCGGEWVLRGNETLRGLDEKVKCFVPAPSLIAPVKQPELAGEATEERSDAEQVMLLYRDMKVSGPTAWGP